MTFDLLTLKVVSESRVTWAISVPILVFLGLCSRLKPDERDRQTDRRQADVRQKHRLMLPPIRGGGIIKINQSVNHIVLILPCFQSRDSILLMHAFITFVRPILEYCSVVWSPAFKKDIVRIEAVQRRFTKRLSGLSKLFYEERLASYN